MPFRRDWMNANAAELASKRRFVDTSSWKYEAWFALFAQRYTRARYKYPGNVATTRIVRDRVPQSLRRHSGKVTVRSCLSFPAFGPTMHTVAIS